MSDHRPNVFPFLRYEDAGGGRLGGLTIDGDVSIDGAVSSRPTIPAQPFEEFSRLLPNAETSELIYGPLTRASSSGIELAIASITVANHGPNDEEARVSSYGLNALTARIPAPRLASRWTFRPGRRNDPSGLSAAARSFGPIVRRWLVPPSD